MGTRVNNSDQRLESILVDHCAMNPSVTLATVKYHGRKYSTNTFGEDEKLHPSLHLRMDQYLADAARLSHLMSAYNNFFSAVITKAEQLADALELLPKCYHDTYINSVGFCDERQTYLCWRSHSTLSADVVTKFNTLHTTVLEDIRVEQLNQLTQ